MSLLLDRAIRLGKCVPGPSGYGIRKLPEAPPVIEAPVILPPIEAVPPTSNAVEALVPVDRPYLIYHHYPSCQDVLKIVAAFYHVSQLDIKSERRTANFVFPRQVVMYQLRHLTLLSYTSIGRFLNGRDHSTVWHAVEKIEGLVLQNTRIADEMALLKIKISEMMAARNASFEKPPE